MQDPGFTYEIRIESDVVLIINSNFQMQAHELANFKTCLRRASTFKVGEMWQFLPPNQIHVLSTRILWTPCW